MFSGLADIKISIYSSIKMYNLSMRVHRMAWSQSQRVFERKVGWGTAWAGCQSIAELTQGQIIILTRIHNYERQFRAGSWPTLHDGANHCSAVLPDIPINHMKKTLHLSEYSSLLKPQAKPQLLTLHLITTQKKKNNLLSSFRDNLHNATLTSANIIKNLVRHESLTQPPLCFRY